MKIYENGLRFKCQGSGKCCTSHGEFGFVFLTLQDRQRFAKYLKITTAAFSRKYCQKTNGVWHLKEEPGKPDCVFLKDKKCGVYEARPTQCRTWPFWPELMNAKSWAKDVVAFCPGVGKGPTISKDHIEAQLLEQRTAEFDMLRSRKV